MIIRKMPTRYGRNSFKIDPFTNQAIPLTDRQRESEGFQQLKAKVAYVLTETKDNSKKLSGFDFEERSKGFLHNIPGLEPAPIFKGQSQESYKQSCEIFSEKLASYMFALQNKMLADNDLNRFDFVEMPEFIYSFKKEELEARGAFSLAEKRKMVTELVQSAIKIQFGSDALFALKPHVFKNDTYDAHAFISPMSIKGNLIPQINSFASCQSTMLQMSQRYKGLILPENTKAGDYKTRIAQSKLSKSDFEYVSKVLAATPFRYIHEFDHADIKLNYIRTNKRVAKNHDARQFESKSSHISGLEITYKGQTFTTKVLSSEADRKLQFMLAADKAREEQKVDLYDFKSTLAECYESSKSFEEFNHNLLAKGFKLKPEFYSKAGKFSHFKIKHEGYKYGFKSSLFELDIKKRYGLDFKYAADYERIINAALDSQSAYFEFSAGELRLQEGETLQAWLARLQKYNRSFYKNLYRQDGDNFCFKDSSSVAFTVNAKAGTATLYKTNKSAIAALAEIYVAQGATTVQITKCINQKDLQEIVNVFAEHGISIQSSLVTPKILAEKEIYIHQKAQAAHQKDLEKFKKYNVEGNRKTVKIKPFIAKNNAVMSYENVFLMFPYYAKQNIKIENINVQDFIDRKAYLLERFKDDSDTLQYLNRIFDIEHMTLEEKKSYLSAQDSKPKRKAKLK